MLAIVEHDQHLSICEEREQAWYGVLRMHRKPEQRCKLVRHQPRVREGGQINKAGAVLVRFEQFVGHRESQRSLADSTGTYDRDKAFSRQARNQGVDDLRAAGNLRER